MRKATPSARALWMRSMSSCSALLWKLTRSCPISRATAAARFSRLSRVSVPYTAGSRLPSRLRFGPFNNSTRAMTLGFLLLKRRSATGGECNLMRHHLDTSCWDFRGTCRNWAKSLSASAGGRAQAPDTLGNLLPCELQAELAGVHVADALQDQLRFVLVQLADLESDDPSLLIGKHTERKDRVHAEGISRGETPLIPDQNRIIDSLRMGVLLDVFRIIDCDPDNFQAICRMFATESFQEGDLTTAGLAPGRPEIDQQGPALPVREAAHRAIDARQPDLGQL